MENGERNGAAGISVHARDLWVRPQGVDNGVLPAGVLDPPTWAWALIGVASEAVGALPVLGVPSAELPGAGTRCAMDETLFEVAATREPTVDAASLMVKDVFPFGSPVQL